MAQKYTYGSSLEALQFADQHDTKLILGDIKFPREHETDEIKLAWGLIYTKLMFKGYIIGGDSVKTVRISDDKITIVCRGNVIKRVDYDVIFVCSDKKIIGLPPAVKKVDVYKVIDHMKPLSLVTKGDKLIETEDKFVSQLFVFKKYPTDPIKIYAISELNEEQLEDFNYSDTMAKFKSEFLLTTNSFLGSHSGGTRLSITLEVLKREIEKKMDFYENSEKVKFVYGS